MDARRVDGVDVEAVPAQLQVVDHLLLQDVADVGAGGDVEAGKPLLGDRRATNDIPALQDLDVQAGPSRGIRRRRDPLCPAPTMTTRVFSAMVSPLGVRCGNNYKLRRSLGAVRRSSRLQSCCDGRCVRRAGDHQA